MAQRQSVMAKTQNFVPTFSEWPSDFSQVKQDFSI